MQDQANFGYYVEISRIREFVPSERLASFDSLVEEQNTEDLNEFLSEHLPEDFPMFEEVYMMRDDDTSDDLEHGKIYVVFDTPDLFEMTPKESTLKYFSGNRLPQLARWVIFG